MKENNSPRGTRALRGTKTKQLMSHMIAGYPSFAASENIARALIEGGSDIIELQIPFSDPMADGPAIVSACEIALKNGASVKKTLALAKKIARFGKPVFLMSYLNPVFQYGIPRFVHVAAQAGVSGLIIPDCPLDSEEGVELLTECINRDLILTPVVSPGVPSSRLKAIIETRSTLVYCTTRRGITGSGSAATELPDFVATLRSLFSGKIALGFGIKSTHDITSRKNLADVFVVGSVYLSLIKNGSGKEMNALVKLTRKLSDAMK